jgi:two-component system invasion response regulator UvrY
MSCEKWNYCQQARVAILRLPRRQPKVVGRKLIAQVWITGRTFRLERMTLIPEVDRDAMKILLVDRQTVVREGLKRILGETLGPMEFGDAEGSEMALELIRNAPWDLVIVDLAFPGSNDLDFLKTIRKSRPRLPVLAMGTQPEDYNAKWALKAGAAGYVTKDSPCGEIVGAVRKILAGGRYMRGALAEKLAWDLAIQSERLPHEALSQRQFDVLRLIASGKTVTETAGELRLSVKTVSTHRSRILEKMGLRTTADLIRYALRNRLVD